MTVITLLKRREGMSREAFRAYYENNHRRIGEKVLGGYASRYVRRYLTPTDGIDQDFDFDVVMEIDFPDEATRDACFAALGDPETLAMIVEDEEKLFDRSRIRTFSVTESVSDLPPPA
ncbi:EthD domain-containing protein [Novosphingobium album (ex Hu et al. 2023)]|uniref:EthD domain-containing protein n=1 Tax=Novosphingobium album (ex Hu et al. 2023) TaxID=2930093 RepID=A0ABT0B138_9SPHN|nr:EthD domain-containing protein [Novosphingobium album (ex Hu et al. 2023)]MCJ2178752.1 EthD domain-containing protein [Novosphingobium album (ex Hu et al. 2023)]